MERPKWLKDTVGELGEPSPCGDEPIDLRALGLKRRFWVWFVQAENGKGRNHNISIDENYKKFPGAYRLRVRVSGWGTVTLLCDTEPSDTVMSDLLSMVRFTRPDSGGDELMLEEMTVKERR